MSLIYGPRVEGWSLLALTPDGGAVDLPLVAGSGRHGWDLSRANPGDLSAVVGPRLADGSPLPDWREVRLRGVYRCNGVTHTLGTWIPSRTPRQLGVGERVQVSGVDLTGLLSRARLRRTVAYPAGTPISETVQALIATYTPSLAAAIGDTDETLRTSLGWDVGTPVLEVANKLLEAAAYTPLASTRDGVIHSARWRPYGERPTVGHFGHGTYAIPYVQDVTADDAHLSRPDQVIAKGRGGQDAGSVSGMWPEYAIPDAVVSTVETEATDVAAATLTARRAWEEARARSLTAPLSGPWQPVMPGDVLGWSWPRHGIEARAELTAMSTDWALGSPTSYQLREVS